LSHLYHLILPRGGTSNSASGRNQSSLTLGDCGRGQAIERAAGSVLAKWKSSRYAGLHRSFCFFGDSNRLGLVRVTISEGLEITCDAFGPEYLPGCPQGLEIVNVSTSAETRTETTFPILRLLAKVLHSKPDSLPFLSTANPSLANNFREIVGRSANTSETMKLRLGDLIGVGGYGDVFLTEPNQENNQFKVVKVLAESEDPSNHMTKEYEILRALQGLNLPFQRFPRISDALLTSDDKVSAIIFEDVGVDLSIYAQAIGDCSELEELQAVLSEQLPAIVEVADSCCIYHNDLRRSNILLVPKSRQTQDQLATSWKGIDFMPFLKSIKLSDCSIIINDWGCATKLATRQSKTLQDAKEKIRNLIKSITGKVQFNDLGHCERDSCKAILLVGEDKSHDSISCSNEEANDQS
jgi:hypothetical protein